MCDELSYQKTVPISSCTFAVGDNFIMLWLFLCGHASHFSCLWLFVAVWTIASQAPLSIGFSAQEYCSALPCLPPGALPVSELEPVSLMSPAPAASFFTTSAAWEALYLSYFHYGVVGLDASWQQFIFNSLEKGMAIHSSILVWRIPWTEKPGRL